MEHELNGLEAACVDFLTHHTAASEEAIQAFCNAENAFSQFQYVLEHTQLPFLQFQAGTALRQASVREWAALSPVQREGLRHYLLDFVVNHFDRLEPFVGTVLLQGVATNTKRGAADGDIEERNRILFERVEALLSSSNVSDRLVALSLLSELVSQHNLPSTPAMSLPHSFHVSAAQRFERAELPKVFECGLVMLRWCTTLNSPTHYTVVLTRALELVNRVFEWEFVDGSTAVAQAVAFRHLGGASDRIKPGVSWPGMHLLLAETTMDLFFELHTTLRAVVSDDDNAHGVRECILSLASITGPVFGGSPAKRAFLERFLAHLLPLLLDENVVAIAAGQGTDSRAMMKAWLELVDISVVVQRLLSNHGGHDLSNLQCLSALAEALCRRTCALAEMVVLTTGSENAKSMEESLELLLSACVALVSQVFDGTTFGMENEAQHNSVKPVVDMATAVFQHVVEYALREAAAETECEEEGELDGQMAEAALNDRLQLLGVLCRAAPLANLGLLQVQLSMRLQTLVSAGGHANVGLLEGLRWLVLCSGHCIADVAPGEGETPMIPGPLNAVSRQLWELNQGLDSDPMISLHKVLAQLCDLHVGAVESGHQEYLSPCVMSALLQYSRRWAGSYLFPDTAAYETLSPTFSVAFGEQSVGAGQAVDLLVRMAVACVARWAGEKDVVKYSCALLHDLVMKKPSRTLVVQSQHFWSMVDAFADSNSSISHLGAASRRQLSEILVRGCSVSENEAEHETLFRRIADPLESQLAAISAGSGTNGPVEHILNLLEMLRGVTLATNVSNHHLILGLCGRHFDSLVGLLRLRAADHDVVLEILKVYRDFADRQTSFLSTSTSHSFLGACANLLRTYSEHASDKMKTGWAQEHEVQHIHSVYKEVLTLLRLLSHLLTSDFFCLPVGQGAAQGQENYIVDVLFAGVGFLLPLVTKDLLMFPKLSRSFFRLIGSVVELYPERVLALGPLGFAALTQAVGVAIGRDNLDDARDGLGAIYALAEFCGKIDSRLQSTLPAHTQSTLGDFLKILLESVMTQAIDPMLLDSVADALLALILWRTDTFVMLAQRAVESSQDERIRVQLSVALQILSEGPINELSRQSRAQMRKNLEKFVVETGTFLRFH